MEKNLICFISFALSFLRVNTQSSSLLNDNSTEVFATNSSIIESESDKILTGFPVTDTLSTVIRASDEAMFTTTLVSEEALNLTTPGPQMPQTGTHTTSSKHATQSVLVTEQSSSNTPTLSSTAATTTEATETTITETSITTNIKAVEPTTIHTTETTTTSSVTTSTFSSITTPVSQGHSRSSTTPRSSEASQTLIIIIGVVSGLILLLVIILSVLCYRIWCQNSNRAIPDAAIPLLRVPESLSRMVEDLRSEAIPVDKFADYVAKRHADTDLLFSNEFEELNNNTRPDKLGISCDYAKRAENYNKNRYPNVLAYDHSRVKLECSRISFKQDKRTSQNHDFVRNDYINANYISGFEKPAAFIAAQAPLPETTEDFWEMVYQRNSRLIVMLTGLIENGRTKSFQYWPSEEQDVVNYGPQITVKRIHEVELAHYTIRVFSLRHKKDKRKSGADRTIHQYHFTAWPDHSVPNSALILLSFVQKSMAKVPPDSGPPVVHCSAGIGRTGCYICIHSMMCQIRERASVSILPYIKYIRSQRLNMIQSEIQYVFLHDALLEFIRNGGETEVKHFELSSYIKRLSSQSVNDPIRPFDPPTPMLQYQFRLISEAYLRRFELEITQMPVNLRKIRQGSLLPAERSRVRLGSDRAGQSAYINAAFFHGYSRPSEFIVTQLPLDNNRQDLWRMVWEHNCSTIVLLQSDSGLQENDSGSQDHDYANLPSRHTGSLYINTQPNIESNGPIPSPHFTQPRFWCSRGERIECYDFSVAFIEDSYESTEHDSFVSSSFMLISKNEDYELMTRMFTFSHWPRASVETEHVFEHIRVVKRLQDNASALFTGGPIVVIDELGGTDAATFCALYTLEDQLINDGSVDVYSLAKMYNQYRPGVFNTKADYFFLYEAIASISDIYNEENSRLSLLASPTPNASRVSTLMRSSYISSP